MIGLLRQTALWRTVRGVKRRLMPPRHDSVLSPELCGHEIVIPNPPAALEAGVAHSWTLRITNQSAQAWATAGRQPVEIVARWITCVGDIFGEPVRLPLPTLLYPGEPATLTISIPTPAFVGDFTLEVDLDQVGGGRFGERTSLAKPAMVAVPVLGPRATDIDYHQVYRTANLQENHWWVVGGYYSRDEYERSSQGRLGMLIQHGLTPDSRVLDIGCGTGQMGDSLQGYLSEKGAYYGTDIGAEAIAFCHERFNTPHFVFRRGEMTRVPFDATDGPFDLAIFFSVFTHTFIDESALLLAEAKRLLGPNGCVMVDIIVSPLVERGSGNRGEMVLNREHFFRIAGILGFAPEVIGRWPWNPHAERLMLLLRRSQTS